MTERTSVHRLQVATELHRFIETQVLPGTGIDSAAFWSGFDAIVADLAPKNIALLAERDRLQSEIDAWHKANPGPIAGARGMKAYRKFLQKIGYLVPVPEKVKATTKNVDAELALQAGPQLVVPITNARYALNAANARWGSLYDALYGTDAMGDAPGAGGYDPVRGARVIAWAKAFLDSVAPLASGSHADVTAYRVAGGALQAVSATGTSAVHVPYQGTAQAQLGLIRGDVHVAMDALGRTGGGEGPALEGAGDRQRHARSGTARPVDTGRARAAIGQQRWLERHLRASRNPRSDRQTPQ